MGVRVSLIVILFIIIFSGTLTLILMSTLLPNIHLSAVDDYQRMIGQAWPLPGCTPYYVEGTYVSQQYCYMEGYGIGVSGLGGLVYSIGVAKPQLTIGEMISSWGDPDRIVRSAFARYYCWDGRGKASITRRVSPIVRMTSRISYLYLYEASCS